MVVFIEIENNEVEAGLEGKTKNIDFEHKFEIHINPLIRDKAGSWIKEYGTQKRLGFQI